MKATIHTTFFPDGTTVGAYDATGYATFPSSGAPGSAVDEAAASGGSVTFEGLSEGVPYYAAAQVGGVWQSVRFSVQVPAVVAVETADLASGVLQAPDRNETLDIATQAELDVERERAEAVEAAKADLEEGTLAVAQLPSSVVTDSAEAPKAIDSTGVSALDLLGYNGTEWGPAEQAQIAAFANPFDTVMFIAGQTRENPTLQSQGMYIQHRVKGDLGGKVHEAATFEHRIFGGSNGGTGQNGSESSLVISGGVNSIAHMNAGVFNSKCEGEPSGTVEDLRLINIQEATKSGTLTFNTVYGLFVAGQTIGTTNYSLYVASGNSVIKGTIVPATKADNVLVLRGVAGQEGNLFAVQDSGTSTWFSVSSKGSVLAGREVSPSATDGFLYIPQVAGAPTGTPTTQSGRAAIAYDKTNNKLYVYNGGWKAAALS